MKRIPYPATFSWTGLENLDVSIKIWSVEGLRLSLGRFVADARDMGIGLEAVLNESHGAEYRVGAFPKAGRGCLGFASQENVAAAGQDLAQTEFWAFAEPGESGFIDFHLDPTDCPSRFTFELCPPLADVLRLVEEFVVTGKRPAWIDWGTRRFVADGVWIWTADRS